MLNKHDLKPEKEEVEKCDTLRYSWDRLQAQAIEVQDHLITVQPGFKKELIADVKVFKVDCEEFYNSYDEVWRKCILCCPLIQTVVKVCICGSYPFHQAS